MRVKREYKRERCFARALLPGIPAFGNVADISPSGIRVRIPGDSPGPIEGRQTITISFEEMAISPFQLTVDRRWHRKEEKSTLIGFAVVACLDEEGRGLFESLLECYRGDAERR